MRQVNIYLCMHTQLGGIYLLLSLALLAYFPPVYTPVNFYPLRELDTIGIGRMDLIITYSGLPPTLPDAPVNKSFS